MPDISPPPETETAVSAVSMISRVNQILYTGQLIKAHFGNFRERQRARNTYTVSVGASDRFYFQLQTWLVQQIRNDNQKSLKAYGMGGTLRFLFDDSNAQTILVDGHKITVSSQKPKSGSEALREELLGTEDDAMKITEPRIVFIASNPDGFEAIKKKLVEVREDAMRQAKEPPRLHFSTGYYDSSSTALRARKIESVVLADGQMDRIVDDLERFRADEQTYIERGLPYQRGYLFYGPPGTGKTSLAKVLAVHFNMDLYYVSLGAIGSDVELAKAIARVPEGSIVLFEDVDVFKGVKDREGDKTERTFSLSGFLNVLDGVMTPHGMIKILTTNEKDVIDPAVLRPGRIDVAEKLDLMHGKQSDRLFEVFYGQPPNETLALEDVAPAAMMEFLKNNMYDPDTAEAQIRSKFLCGS